MKTLFWGIVILAFIFVSLEKEHEDWEAHVRVSRLALCPPEEVGGGGYYPARLCAFFQPAPSLRCGQPDHAKCVDEGVCGHRGVRITCRERPTSVGGCECVVR